MLITQVLPEVRKDATWAKENVDAIVRMVGGGPGRSKDALCYDLYYGAQDQRNFEYLTGQDEYKMPASVRFMPIAKPYFELLKSTCESRDIVPTVYSVDEGSLTEKKKVAGKMLVDRVLARMDDGQMRIDMLKSQLAQQRERAQQEGGDPMAIQQLDFQLQQVEKAISRGEEVLQEELQDMEQKRKLNLRTSLEVQMDHAMRALIRRYDWKHTFDQCFEDLLIVDQQVVRIEDVYMGKDPSIRRVNPRMISYGAQMDANWLDECPWVLEHRFMPVSQVLDEFGDDMTDEQRGDIDKHYAYHRGFTTDNYYGYAGNSFNSLPLGPTEACTPAGDIYAGTSMYTSDMIEVCMVAWKSVKRLTVKMVEDKEVLTTHLITDEEAAGEKGKKEFRYVTEWWEGVKIGGNIYVRMRKIPFQHRDIHAIGTAYGPYIGHAYNGVDKRPYSRVYATKDISILYNLVYYQMELLIALAGIKGMIMDKSQIPKDMEMEEWFYHFKMGTAWIDSMRMGPNGRPSNYNQFGTYDLSFGTSIQQMMLILERLEYLAGRVIGIPPQRLGEVTKDTLVGTQKQAIAQSNLTTETLFHKHRRFIRRVLDRCTNVITYAWKDGKRGQYTMGRMGQQIFNIGCGELDGVRMETFLDDDGQNEMIMAKAHEAVAIGFQKGQISFSQLVESFSMNNIDELKASVEHWEGIARKMANGARREEVMGEQEMMKMKAELDAMVKKQLTDGEQLKAQIDQTALQLEAERAKTEADVRLAETRMKTDVQQQGNDTKAQVDMAYLQEETRKTNIETALRRLELMMAAQSKNNSISSGPNKNPASQAA